MPPRTNAANASTRSVLAGSAATSRSSPSARRPSFSPVACTASIIGGSWSFGQVMASPAGARSRGARNALRPPSVDEPRSSVLPHVTDPETIERFGAEVIARA